jgi:hypothetical protein
MNRVITNRAMTGVLAARQGLKLRPFGTQLTRDVG